MKMNIWNRILPKTRIHSDHVSLVEMIFGYFLGPICVLMMTCVTSTYYLTFYRSYDDVMAQGNFLTLLPLLSVIPIALSNAFFGMLVGKTKSREGKARPYLFLVSPLLLISGVLIFCIPNLGLGFRLVWMVITYNLFAAIVSPIYGTAHYLMVSLSTRNLEQRGKLSVVANIPAVAGNGLISSILMPLIISWINEAADVSSVQQRWKIVMIVLSVLAALGCMIEYLYTRERITEEDMKSVTPQELQPQEVVSATAQIRAAMRDKYWWIVMIFYALYQAGIMFKSGYVFNIFCHEFFVDTEFFGIVMSADMIQSVLALISGVPLAVGMVFIWPLANRFGKKNVVVAGCVISIIGSLICIMEPSNFVIMLIGQTFKGFSSIPGAYIMMALFADVLDHLEARFGFRVDGITMSVYNTVLTVVNGLAVAFFNFFYDAGIWNRAEVAEFFFLKFEIIAHAILIVILCFLTVEKNIAAEQALIAKRKEKQ